MSILLEAEHLTKTFTQRGKNPFKAVNNVICPIIIAGMDTLNGYELSTLFPDYSMSGLPEWTGYILSAIVGVALLVIIFKIISSMMKEKVDFKKKAA